MKGMLDAYRDMLLIRYFENRVEDLFSRGHIEGTAHPATGQEAAAVGVCRALAKRDYVTSTHRGHGHFLARGGDPRRIMAELFGKATGYSLGRGGSQVMSDFSIGFLGANGITGGGLPLATGAALSTKLRRTGQVTACFFGDGAANQGTFHESLNMAAIWRLPVVYVCENNRYAMSTPASEALAIADVSLRANSYGFPGITVDGNDVLAVYEATAAAVVLARRGGGPTLIECKTYRLSGHSRGDPQEYKCPEEEREWRRRDPIALFRRVLFDRGLLPKKKDAALKAEARQTVRNAVAFARKSREPDPDTLTEGVFA